MQSQKRATNNAKSVLFNRHLKQLKQTLPAHQQLFTQKPCAIQAELIAFLNWEFEQVFGFQDYSNKLLSITQALTYRMARETSAAKREEMLNEIMVLSNIYNLFNSLAQQPALFTFSNSTVNPIEA